MEKFTMIVKQMIKFVFLDMIKVFSMKIVNYSLLFIVFFFLATTSTRAQCEWLYEGRESDSYTEDNGEITLYYCSDDTTAVINAPNEGYINTEWRYFNTDGTQCLDLDNADASFFQPLNINNACVPSSYPQVFEVDFVGTLGGNTIDICTFEIVIYQVAEPEIEIREELTDKSYNTGETPNICEQVMIDNMLTLHVAGTGINIPISESSEFQWYLGGFAIEGANSASLEVSTIDYNINEPSRNTFTVSVANFCTGGEHIKSSDRSIEIYEGYGEECNPCEWLFPDYEANQFYIFTPNEDGIADHFPEAPNNESNRIHEIQNKLSQPTCEATTYRLSIYNRLGRELFTSEHDNHPWNGKMKNGKQCKEGVYFYKIEYILNPHITDYEQHQTKIATGTVYLDSGN